MEGLVASVDPAGEDLAASVDLVEGVDPPVAVALTSSPAVASSLPAASSVVHFRAAEVDCWSARVLPGGGHPG